MKKINVITLGCSKNTVDSEHLMARLAAAGYEVLFDSDRTDAKVVVINTCGFIGDAKQESVDMILRAAAAKNAGKIERLFVIGCLSERYADSLRAELPEVDGFFGARTWDGIARALGAAEDPALATERHLSTPRHYAYLKISEGCNWKCGYCAIPLIRGGHVSVPMEELEEEARKLAAGGVKELIVIAQDITKYGMDLPEHKRLLPELLRELCKMDFTWIRLHYLYPDQITDELIDVIADEPKIVKYLDIPLQHVSKRILRAMHRPGDGAEFTRLIENMRERIPGLVLRTSLIVGLPGETEDEFAELCEFLQNVGIERVGVFEYSPEEGTEAAELPDQIDDETKQNRRLIVEELQSGVLDDYNTSRHGEVMQVLCEGFDEEQGLWYGRTYADSVEVDGHVYFDAADNEPAEGEFVSVLITESLGPDLLGVRQKEA